MPDETSPDTHATVEAISAEAVADGDEVAILRAQLDAANDAFLRARADFANFKRRTEDEKETLRQFLMADLLTRLLPIVDDFDRALAAAAQTPDTEKLLAGIEGIHRKLLDLLAREGVSPIEAVGQSFDPNLHNAVLRDEGGGHPDNTVVEELQKGYTLGGRVLRPTLVKVATGG